MNLSALCIRRPIACTLLSLAVLLAGIFAYPLLPVSALPRVDFPTISVSAALPGASPETMASAVATPLERRLGRIAGLSEMTSTSGLGSCNIVLQFSLDKSIQSAARDVQAAINAAGGELPANLPLRPSFRKINPADAPIMVLALRSKSRSLSQIYADASTVLAQKLSQIQGVGEVFVGGGQQAAVRVQACPQVLAGVGLTLEDVRTCLATANGQQAKGDLQTEAQSFAIAADAQMFTAEAYRQLIVSYTGQAPVRLGEIARVEDGVENSRVAAWYDTERAILMIIRREPGANTIATIDQIQALLPSMMQAISADIDVQVAINQSATIRAAVRDVESTLIITVLLVIAVVYFFLQNVRATCIPSAAIPLSVVGTFAAMYVLDYSIDNLSLMALTISTGFVVDDAIVVTENIMRGIERGQKPLAAALQGAQEIAFTVLSITASLLAVFVPILAMGGIMGRLFREFAVVLSVAVVLSAIVSLTLTPMMCAYLLRARAPDLAGSPATGPGIIERFLRRLTTHYARGLQFALAHVRLMLALTLATVALSVYLFVVIPKGLLPQQDNGMMVVVTQGPQDISFAAMRSKHAQVQQVLRDDPAVAHVVSFIGGGGGGSNSGMMFVALQPKRQRGISVDGVINRLRAPLRNVAGVSVFMQGSQDVRVGGRSARTQYQYTLQDARLDVLKSWAPRLQQAFAALPQLRDVSSDQQTGGLQAYVHIDREASARFGITPQHIDNTLYDAFGQRQVATVFTQAAPAKVILELLPSLPQSPEMLTSLYVRSQQGGLVPLSTIAHVSREAAALSVNHQGQLPAITLSFNLAPNTSLGEAIAAIETAKRALALPNSMTTGFAGNAQAFAASSANMPLLLLAALAVVYMVLGILYESFIHPLTILSTLPSAGVGALIALQLCGQAFDIIGLIGIILLIGIVKKNAIMMIDFALQACRERGLSSRDAIVEACLLRLRPILMTTVAALLSAIPLAVGWGMGAELRRPLGIALVGGLLVSQLLTLFTTPVVFLCLDRFSRRAPQ